MPEVVVRDRADTAATGAVLGDRDVRVRRAVKPCLGSGDVPAQSRNGVPQERDDADHVRAGHRRALEVRILVSLAFVEERVEAPGATMSGLIRPEPSMVTGPRLLKPTTWFVPVINAPVEYEAA